VKLEVARIGQIDDPSTDTLYASTGKSRKEKQPGLHGARVQGGKVLLEDGKDPYVRFSEYGKHWNAQGVDFYAFRVRFGRGDFIPAGDRDYHAKEKSCLHMKFTVAIQADQHATYSGPTNLKDYLDTVKYFRPYLAWDIATPKEYVRFMGHRFIFLFLGHGSSGCLGPGHPRKAKGGRKEMPDKDFPPDEYKCPTALPQGFDAKEYGGCGSRTHVYQRVWACRKKHPEDKGQPKAPVLFLRWDNLPLGDRPGEIRFFWQEVRFDKGKPDIRPPKDKTVYPLRGLLPRFLFYNGSCMSLTTPGLGRRVVQGGTRYYMGWVYVSRSDWNADFPLDVFKKWLGEYKHGQDPDNVGADMFSTIWLDRSKAGEWRVREPRLMDRRGICTTPPLNAKEQALYGLYRKDDAPDHVPDVSMDWKSPQSGGSP